jgi:hypothetical protein
VTSLNLEVKLQPTHEAAEASMSLRMPKADNMPLFKSGYTFSSGIEEAVLR